MAQEQVRPKPTQPRSPSFLSLNQRPSKGHHLLTAFSFPASYPHSTTFSDMAQWKRLVRFEDETGKVNLGEPVDPKLDVGLEVAAGRSVQVNLIEGDAFTGKVTAKKATIKKVRVGISGDCCPAVPSHAVQAADLVLLPLTTDPFSFCHQFRGRSAASSDA